MYFALEASEFIYHYIEYMFYIMVFLLLTLAVLLIFFAFSGKVGFSSSTSKKKKKKSKQSSNKKRFSDGVNPGCCPLCGFVLLSGEKINSIVYEGRGENGRMCRITGCPHCNPLDGSEPDEGAERICPVCRKTVPLEGYLTARLFDRGMGSHHVHITGCTECHKK